MFWNWLRGSSTVSPVILNSLPKSGTHMLGKALGMFPGLRSPRTQISRKTLAEFTKGEEAGVTVPIGIDWPEDVPLANIEAALQRLKSGHSMTWHVPFSDALADLIDQMGLKMLVMLRDPRDVVISHAGFVAETPVHFLYAIYQPLSQEERLMTSITGLSAVDSGGPMLLNIHDRYNAMLRWRIRSFCYTTTFEKLVGPRGGGTHEDQIHELTAIAQHLEIARQPEQIEQMAEKVFGGTRTFRKGAIGNWKETFNEAHKRVFKEIAGQLLIDSGYEQDRNW